MNKTTMIMLSAGLLLGASACSDDGMGPMPKELTLKVENLLKPKPLVESGAFKGTGTPPVILPGQQVSFSFSAGKGQALSFATMYGWSNDLFFGPANPGIALYDNAGKPVEGDVSAQLKLWDNGTMNNQQPGKNNLHNGGAENGMVKEVKGMDAAGFSYLPAGKLMKASLRYEGHSVFTLTIANISGGTANETPFSPGVWTVSAFDNGKPVNGMPLFSEGQKSANGLQPLAEMGNNEELLAYVKAQTGIITGLSPVLAVVYEGDQHPLFTEGQKDEGKGLSKIAQMGDASVLAQALQGQPGIKKVYVIEAPQTKAIPPGASASMHIVMEKGDKLAIATMFGSSNDWFFAFGNNGVTYTGEAQDLTGSVMLWDDGTEVNEYPGAGDHQAAFNADANEPESNPVMMVNTKVYPIPAIAEVLKVTLSR